MRKIFNGNYKRLDDDVSFQILRTNPRLTTNTKLLYNGEKMYLESYDANGLLSTQKYKSKRVWRSGLFNNDIKNFLMGTNGCSYIVGSKMENDVVGNDYNNQFENMYWCGAEEITSNTYSEELGIISPLYLRKKIPNYFVVFKIDGPSNFIMRKDEKGKIIDNVFNFKDDILNKSTIVKSFDLREGTPIGDYLRNYVTQSTFEFDKPMYVNFSTNEIYYYGIDVNNGSLTNKVENFKKELLENDNTILHDDDWFTEGYRRNNLIFPYIINLEFLFDDNDTEDYKFCRYFGYYCDDIDLYEFNQDSDVCLINENYQYYIKDKYDNLHEAQKFTLVSRKKANSNKDYGYVYSKNHFEHAGNIGVNKNEYDFEIDIRKSNLNFTIDNLLNKKFDELGIGNYTFDDSYNIKECHFVSFRKPTGITSGIDHTPKDHEINKNSICVTDKTFDEELFTGYKPKTLSAYCNYEFGLGYASFMFSIEKPFNHGDRIDICYKNNIGENVENLSFYAEKIESVYDENGNAIYVYENGDVKIDVIDKNGKPEFLYDENISDDIKEETSQYYKIEIAKTSYEKDEEKIENDFYARIYSKNNHMKVLKRKYIDCPIGKITDNRFSCNGNVIDIAHTLCDCINNYESEYNLYNVKRYNNILVIKYARTGSFYNSKLYMQFSKSIESNDVIKKYSRNNSNNFYGGTDEKDCLFRVKTDDIDYYMGESGLRYLRTINGYDDALIESYSYCIDEYGDIDERFYIISTDKNGKYVRISDVRQAEIIDKFYPKFGMLSFYPVKDFDFDTIYSSYCDNSVFLDEVKRMSSKLQLKDYIQDSNKYISISDYSKDSIILDCIGKGNLYNDDKNVLESEYDYFFENLLPSLCMVNKTVGHICKWGYVDGVDSCDNPYRLNANKIFGVDNLSPNLFIHDGIKDNFTLEMPYYICNENKYDGDKENNNEYQYIMADSALFLHNNISQSHYMDVLEKWKNIFKSTEENNFDKYFRLPEYNKRHSKRYSKFKNGNSYKKSSTLFRGVEFNISEMKGKKDIKNSKYNNYDFSFVYIPCYDTESLYFNNTIHFIKNDKYKFVVGLIVCNIFTPAYNMNKTLLYSGCKNVIRVTERNMASPLKIIELKDVSKIYFTMKFKELFYCNNDGIHYNMKKMRIISPMLKSMVDIISKAEGKCNISRIEFRNQDNSEYVTYENDEIRIKGYNVYISSMMKGETLVKDYEDEIINVTVYITCENQYYGTYKETIKAIYN